MKENFDMWTMYFIESMHIKLPQKKHVYKGSFLSWLQMDQN